MKRMLSLTLCCVGSCLSNGCVMTASELAKYSNPAIKAHHSFLFGTSVEIGTNFKGKGKLQYDPKTGAINADVEIDSDVVSVVDAEGRRITEGFIQLRKDEAARVVEQHRIAGDTIKSVAGTIAQGFGLIGAKGTPQDLNAAFNASLPVLAELLKTFKLEVPVAVPAPTEPVP